MTPNKPGEGRLRLLEEDPTVAAPERDKGLLVQDAKDHETYSQSEIDDLLKLMNQG